MVLGIVAQKQSLADTQAAPPLLSTFSIRQTIPQPSVRDVAVPAGAYDPAFVEQLKSHGLVVHDVPQATAGGMRGTAAAVAFDSKTQSWQSTDTAGVLLRSEEHTSELQSLMRTSYAVFCL